MEKEEADSDEEENDGRVESGKKIQKAGGVGPGGRLPV